MFYRRRWGNRLYGKGRVAVKKRREHLACEPWKRMILGVGVSVVCVLTMTAAGAALMDREMVSMEWMNYLAALALVVSSLIGGITAAADERRWMGPLAAGAGLWLFLLAVNALGYDGDLSGALPTALAIAGGSGAAILLSGGGKSRPKHRRRYRSR